MLRVPLIICTTFWCTGSAADIAKWQSWKHLENMNKMEAMRLYVRTVEEEDPDWYGLYLKIGSMQQEAAEERSASGDDRSAPGKK